MKNKVLSLEDLPAWRKARKAEGKKIVATNGCFDILHVGHLRYMQQARALGDLLVVGLNSDQSVRSLKGPERPLNNEDERAEMLAGLEAVDLVTVFNDMRATHFLEIVQPDIYVKGGDYKPEQLNQEEMQAVKNGGGEIKILPLVPGRSTSSLIQKIQKL